MMVVSFCGDRGALVVRAWEEAGRAGTVCESAHKIYIFFFFFFLAMMSEKSKYSAWMDGIMREAKSG
jgi:hypothetical protein